MLLSPILFVEIGLSKKPRPSVVKQNLMALLELLSHKKVKSSNTTASSLAKKSVIKPDPALRQCAHNQLCYHELMDVREDVLNYLKTKRWN